MIEQADRQAKFSDEDQFVPGPALSGGPGPIVRYLGVGGFDRAKEPIAPR